MDSSDTTYVLSYDSQWGEDWEGRARYRTGKANDSRNYDDVGGYGLAVVAWNSTNAAYNVAAHECLHTHGTSIHRPW